MLATSFYITWLTKAVHNLNLENLSLQTQLLEEKKKSFNMGYNMGKAGTKTDKEPEKIIIRTIVKTEVTPEILKAVKYAVIKSHPDNGGKEEDFIMFRELQKKLTKTS